MARPYLVGSPTSGSQSVSGSFDVAAGLSGAALIQAVSPASFTVPTGYYAVYYDRLTIAGSSRATLAGTARVRVVNG
jgi:hypothetical protein